MSIRRRSVAGETYPGWREVPFPSAPPAGPPTDPALAEAIGGLHARRPDLSACGRGPRWLLPIMLLLLGSFAFGLVLEPLNAWSLIGALLLAPFLLLTALRILAAVEASIRPTRARRTRAPRTPDHLLPRYAVLAPMYDEPEVLPTLVRALSSLDYPAERLDLVLVLEARDTRTVTALDGLALPANMRVVLVPQGGPKTKPKALNYALASVRADLVVVYDAEDRPEPDQLRIAARTFADAGPDLACLQARLNVYNAGDSFWSRQFALEYAALFDGLLPALDRLRLPIPLGGTSNHFRLPVLRAVGAWDPYNVTEDADLGIRLARMGYRTATIPSTTWEEAPVGGRVWLGQRTRWLKGWIQTWLVHMRRPRTLLRELGAWQFMGVQAVMGGVLLSVLVYPVALLALALAWGSGAFDAETIRREMPWLWIAALANLGLGMLAPMLAAALAVVKRRRLRLLPSVLLMPLYWLLISVAGYWAVIDLHRRPFHWEKTRHGFRRGRTVVPPRPRPPPLPA
jgi:cellulose synthase/poly-beta-1,6-N-acetylglucosamine synthase-like glycosyltransferase